MTSSASSSSVSRLKASIEKKESSRVGCDLREDAYEQSKEKVSAFERAGNVGCVGERDVPSCAVESRARGVQVRHSSMRIVLLILLLLFLFVVLVSKVESVKVVLTRELLSVEVASVRQGRLIPFLLVLVARLLLVRVGHVVDPSKRILVVHLALVLVRVIRVERDPPRELLLPRQLSPSLVVVQPQIAEDPKLLEASDELGRAEFKLVPDLGGGEVVGVEGVERGWVERREGGG